jgi:phosphoserine aminotransferase
MLPEEVLERAKSALVDLDGTGIGILEHSHRGKAFGAVLERTEAAVREVGGLGDDTVVLFVSGGATMQFAMVPASFLAAGATADYCNTGTWSQKAIADARRYGDVHLACDGGGSFAAIPATCTWSTSPVYVHYTSNNTIYGTQWAAPPQGAPAALVCDASSDIFSRPLPWAGHGLVYAGAQKNLGPSGITLVIARRAFVETGTDALPALQSYRTYMTERSLYNTPNTFGIFMIGEVCAWILRQGGLEEMARRNREKAAVLYDFLDASTAWKPHAEVGSRSPMNVTFRGATTALEDAFLARAEAAGMTSLRGHRSVGGLRASIYNAFPIEGVRALVDLLHAVERDAQ